MPAPLDDWIAAREAAATRSLARAVSATGLVHRRTELGREVRPAPGSVLASPRPARWDPEPDYVFHWPRDAAIVMRAVPLLIARAASADEAADWRRRFADYVAFSLAISDPDRPPLEANPLRGRARPEAERFLRPDEELRALRGDAVLGEPRVEADGLPDLERWGRPQFDGPALRAASALAVLSEAPELDGPEVRRLIRRDLDFTRRQAGRPCLGPWEEEPARRDAFTLISQWDALDRGAGWLAVQGQDATDTSAAAAELLRLIDAAWDPEMRAWRASLESGPAEIDAAVPLAAIFSAREDGPLSLASPRLLGTVAAIERRDAALHPINREADPPLIGRWAGDAYFGGNPWQPTTLGFAELHFALAALAARRGPLSPEPESAAFFERVGGDAAALFARGEAWLARLRAVDPGGDALPEQIDRETGAPTGALDLSWSAAAFLMAAEARRRARQAMAR